MTIGKQLHCVLMLLILLCAGCSGNDADQPRRPNILLILTDDLGNNDIASWGDGKALTPTLDQLSRQSVRLRQHYTDSTCSPSRAALLTGQHPVNIGFQPNGLGLSSDLQTLPKSLKALGYHTAHVGKWHVGEALEYAEIQPGNQGFDYWLGFLNHFVLKGPSPDGETLQRRPTHINPWLQENGQPPVQHQGYLDDLLTDKAIELISTNENDPWFINLWLYSPHTPYQPSPEFKVQFPDTPDGHFLAVLKQLDHNVERLLAALKARGLVENTIVVFASDNGGPNIARDNNFPLLGKKATYLEGGVRSPLLIHWPAHYENTDINSVTHITDLFPTLVRLAGGSTPKGLMGRDITPLLRGDALPEPEALFWSAESGPLDMTYAGAHFSEKRFFYREPFGTLISQAITPSIASPSTNNRPVLPFSAEQANTHIAKWEREVRRVDLNWQPSNVGRSGYLSGKDLQRAPVFAGYSLGMRLEPSSRSNGTQTLVEQSDVWSIELGTDQRLKLLHGDTELYSAPVALNSACDTLVASFDIQQAYTYPFPSKARSRAVLYFNGLPVLDSGQLLSRPPTAQALTNPTYIGAKADGTGAYQGQIGRPILINKMLFPEQEGYKLSDMLTELCQANSQDDSLPKTASKHAN